MPPSIQTDAGDAQSQPPLAPAKKQKLLWIDVHDPRDKRTSKTTLRRLKSHVARQALLKQSAGDVPAPLESAPQRRPQERPDSPPIKRIHWVLAPSKHCHTDALPERAVEAGLRARQPSSPARLGTNHALDPFDTLPSKMSPSSPRVIDAYLQNFIQPPASALSAFFSERRRWFSKGLKDPFMLPTIVLASLAFYRDFAPDGRQVASRDEIIQAKINVYRVLNARLSNERDCRANEVLVTVANLCIYELTNEDESTFNSHIGGLRRLFLLRDGFASHDVEPSMKMQTRRLLSAKTFFTIDVDFEAHCTPALIERESRKEADFRFLVSLQGSLPLLFLSARAAHPIFKALVPHFVRVEVAALKTLGVIRIKARERTALLEEVADIQNAFLSKAAAWAPDGSHSAYAPTADLDVVVFELSRLAALSTACLLEARLSRSGKDISELLSDRIRDTQSKLAQLDCSPYRRFPWIMLESWACRATTMALRVIDAVPVKADSPNTHKP